MFTAPREKQTDRDEGEVCWHTPAPRTYLLSSCYVFNSFIPSINDRTLLQHLATGGDTTLPHAAQPSLFPALSMSLRRSSRSLHTMLFKVSPWLLIFRFSSHLYSNLYTTPPFSPHGIRACIPPLPPHAPVSANPLPYHLHSQ